MMHDGGGGRVLVSKVVLEVDARLGQRTVQTEITVHTTTKRLHTPYTHMHTYTYMHANKKHERSVYVD